ncbi:MAG: hypothetical protein V1684_02525 [bacterium]
MPFDESSLPFFQEGLKLINYCPVCQNRYEQLEAKILEEREDACLIHLKCRRCSSSVVALVIANVLGVTSVGLITDLASEEVLKFKNLTPIGADEVIGIHQFLSADKESFKQLMF